MIGIDMKMPHSCRDCDILDAANGQCSITHAIAFTDKRLSDCPLHPLDDEIRVGDEVCFNDCESFKAVVLDESIVNGSWCVLTENGCVSIFDEKKLHRTGRHFDDVVMMLKKMRDEEDA